MPGRARPPAAAALPRGRLRPGRLPHRPGHLPGALAATGPPTSRSSRSTPTSAGSRAAVGSTAWWRSRRARRSGSTSTAPPTGCTATTAASCAPGGRRSWSSVLVQPGDAVAEGRPGGGAGEHEDGVHGHRAVRRRGRRGRRRRQRPGRGRRAAAAHPRGRATAAGARRGPPGGPHRAGRRPAVGHAAVRAGVRRAAQLPARLRPRPGDRAAAAVEQRRLGEISPPADPGLLRCEDGLLDLFADVGALYRPADRDRARDDLAGRAAPRSTCCAYLQWLDADRAGLPDAVPRRGSSGRSPATASTGWTAPRARGGRRLDVPVVPPGRRAGRPWSLVDPRTPAARRQRARGRWPTPEMRAPARPAGGRGTRAGTRPSPSWPATCGSATSTSRCSSASSRRRYAETERHLDALAAEPAGPDREARSRGSWAPRSRMRGRAAAPLARTADRDVRRRSCWRSTRAASTGSGTCSGLTFDAHGGVLLCAARLRLRGQAHPPRRRATRRWPTSRRRWRRRRAPARRARRTGRSSSTSPPGARARSSTPTRWPAGWSRAAARLRLRPRACGGWTSTVTTPDGDRAGALSAPSTSRFRPTAAAGFAEDLLYRNLHPMLAKRLDLWRLANFRARAAAVRRGRVPVPRRRAREPEGRPALRARRGARPHAGPGRDRTAWRRTRWLERMGLQALAAMRAGAGGVRREASARKANRIVLYVRPPWDVPREPWRDLARTFAPLADGRRTWRRCCCGSGSPSRDGSVRDAVLRRRRASAASGVTVRERPPADEPIRPLTPYRQKVLRAQRFGVPYPYEIVRDADAAAAGVVGRLPARHVRRARPRRRTAGSSRSTARTGQNTANVVVGLLTNRTDEGPRGDDAGRDPRRPDPRPRATSPSRSAGGSWPRSTSPSGCDVPVEWFALSSGALHRDGQRHREHGLDRRRAARGSSSSPRRGGEINIVVTGINVGAPAVLERRGDDAHAHPGHPRDDADQRDGAHRQAGAGLLRRGLGRGQLRHRRVTTG